MTSTKLLPCPFCGSEGKSFIDVVSINNSFHVIRCFECGAQSGLAGTVEEAAAAWNRREDPGELPY